MNKEVKETIKILQNNSLVKSGSYEFIGDSDITYAEIYILLKFIEDLQQENQQLKILISAREEVCDRLESNWNKLKEIAKSQSGFKKRADLKGGLWFEIDDLLDKMQELEQGSDSNE